MQRLQWLEYVCTVILLMVSEPFELTINILKVISSSIMIQQSKVLLWLQEVNTSLYSSSIHSSLLYRKWTWLQVCTCDWGGHRRYSGEETESLQIQIQVETTR